MAGDIPRDYFFSTIYPHEMTAGDKWPPQVILGGEAVEDCIRRIVREEIKEALRELVEGK